jgi:uncharacterized protein YciI
MRNVVGGSRVRAPRLSLGVGFADLDLSSTHKERCPRIGGDMAYYLLFYEIVDNFVELRAPFRESHLRLAQQAHERGELVMAGAFGEPVDGAVLLFRSDEGSTAEDFAKNDPYVREGLVPAWRVRQWHEVLTGE